jgi:hypothetical protein
VNESTVDSMYPAVITGFWSNSVLVPAPNVAASGYVCGARPRWLPSKSGSVSTQLMFEKLRRL